MPNRSIRSSFMISGLLVSSLIFTQPAFGQSSDQAGTIPSAIAAVLDSPILPAPDADLVLPRQFITSGPASWQRGLIAYQQGNYEQAEYEFRKTVNRFNSSVLGSRFGGAEGIQQLILAGNFSQTGSRIRDQQNNRRGISAREDSLALASYALGATLIRQQRYNEARNHLSRALGYDKSLHDARLRLGLIALTNDDIREAKRRLRQLRGWCGGQRCEGQTLQRSVATLEDAIAIYEARTESASTR